ncbi:hypothetical protein BJV85_001590 [Clostridium acetobutylicum]|uniref:Hypothetical secreted protein n=1 Tax=Clostridium acetobutylicum (strain ATCC 824 / DSM 792 / JCM 1419 / IAM 19013 / LMG 5710 / NBRC 13948 / NRRL B-527 / VKM B-1787 / 2291 / W) TaxID=272562 RepID=Q97GS2_CLOAB|nr:MULTISPECIES: hypothetical protein [Clostridium]AAK80250.1 Hypothetical secreted protein [Clostridium acetobutylicum ATCC 824]ADZ21346.1 Hypothetical secreted protein [Clostridium acetobutylicum EA 2018]AEI32269.1 hypothetical protein SMB_G2327 [Clostridium acetobutylicum DSM 1731]AWV79326.1 hypothetical protein DK921_04285 [Clostridium acetobutylicum]MBC2394703.1 hypothetical protein [Clostridium acetobutylicum]
MKNLKLKALSLGIISTLLISSSSFAATTTKNIKNSFCKTAIASNLYKTQNANFITKLNNKVSNRMFGSPSGVSTPFQVIPVNNSIPGIYAYHFVATGSSLEDIINFDQRARYFELVLRDSSGHIVASHTFLNAGKRDESGQPQGVLNLDVTLPQNVKLVPYASYSMEIQNLDSVSIGGMETLYY